VFFSIGFAGSMHDLTEASFNGYRRQCLYDNGTPVDVRDSVGDIQGVRCVRSAP
jgi:hypothetical protein